MASDRTISEAAEPPVEVEYEEPVFEFSDFDTVEAVAALAAPIFALHGWSYTTTGIPNAARLAETISRLYDMHRKQPMDLTSTGRFVLVDENPHNGTPVLHEGVRVFLDLGELPPLHGDVLTPDDSAASSPDSSPDVE